MQRRKQDLVPPQGIYVTMSFTEEVRPPLHSTNYTRDNSTYGHHQMVNIEIRLIIFFTAKDGEALYSQQKQDQELTVAQIMTPYCQIQT